MNGSNMRDKARAIFGKTFFENTKEPAPAKNGAVALQKRANARPIPTYKVGGVVKKQAGGALTAAEKARAEKMIRERGDAAMRDALVMRYLEEKNRAPMGVPGMGPKAAERRAEGGKIQKKSEGGLLDSFGRFLSDIANEEDRDRYGRPMNSVNRSQKTSSANSSNRMERNPSATNTQTVKPSATGEKTTRLPEDEKKYVRLNEKPQYVRLNEKRKYVNLDPSVMKKGGKANRYAEGGGIEAQRLEARTASGNYKKGGKIKKKADGGVMDQYDAMPASVQQTGYQQAAPAYSEYGAGPKPMQQMVANPNPVAPAYKKGGKVMKKSNGGTAANAPAYRPTPEMAAAANARINARMAARNTPEMLAKQRALTEKRAKVAASAAKSAALMQKAKDNSAKYAANQKAFADRTAAAVQQARANPSPSPLMQRIQANKQSIQANKQQIAANEAARAANQKAFADRKAARTAANQTPVNRAVGGAGKTRKGMC
jgi:hypothetical protein